jgi:hypothetical protein
MFKMGKLPKLNTSRSSATATACACAAREQAALAQAVAAREAMFDRLQWQAELRTHLDRLAAANAAMAAELSLFERVPSTIPSRA